MCLFGMRDGGIKIFSDKVKLREFVSSRPMLLEEWLKEFPDIENDKRRIEIPR